jgi:hypothetical protein
VRPLALALALAGCSATFTRPPPTHTRWGDPVSCGTSRALPIFDIAWGATAVLVAAGTATASEYSRDDKAFLVPYSLVPAIFFALSAYDGWTQGTRCRFLKERASRERGE